MLTEIIIYSKLFNAPKELVDFAKSIGYDSYLDEKFVIDPRAVKFIRSNIKKYESIYEGTKRDSGLIKSGGFAQILKVDTSRSWTVEQNRFDTESLGFIKIRYVDIKKDSNGRVTINTDYRPVKDY